MEEFICSETNSIHHHLLLSRIKRDQCDVQDVHDTISSVFINPFSQMELVSLSTGIATTDKIKTDLLDVHAIGETATNKFILERLVNTTTQFFEPLRKLKMGKFSSMKKVIKVWRNGKVSAQSNIFGKIVLIQQRRKIDLKEVFCYPLGPVPWSLASVTGGMVKTNKTILMHKLERGMTFADAIPKPFASVIDGMALVRQSNYIGLHLEVFCKNYFWCFQNRHSLSWVSIQLNEKKREIFS